MQIRHAEEDHSARQLGDRHDDKSDADARDRDDPGNQPRADAVGQLDHERLHEVGMV